MSRPAVSQHLRVLLQARLVEVRRQGRVHLYQPRLAGLEVLRRELDAFWGQALANLKAVAEQNYQAEPAPRGEARR